MAKKAKDRQSAALVVPLRTGRGAEIGLLIFAAIIVTAAFCIVQLSQRRTLTWDLGWYALGYLTVLTVSHLLVRAFAPHADPLMLPLVSLLNGLGLVMIYRLDLAAATKAAALARPIPAAQAPMQLIWTGLALVLFLLVMLIIRDHTTLQFYAYSTLFVGLVFLAIPSVLPARFSEVNGAKIWIKIPRLFSIQPAEFTKIALIIFAAAFLTSKATVLATAGKRIFGLVLPRIRDLGPLVIALAVALAVLVRGTDLGTSLLLFGTLLTMIYMATSRVSWLIIGLLGFAAGCVLMYSLFGHIQLRVSIWLHPFADPQKRGFQLVQSLFGLGSGGIFGTGLGSGHPEIVPFASTDFITAAIGEELGLFGFAGVLLCYLLLISRGLRTALAVKDNFGSLLAAGLSFAIGLQVFIIVGGVTRLIPLTGLTTPFLSYGGSSLLANYIILALLMRISDSSRTPVRVRNKIPEPLTDAATQMVPVVRKGGDGA